MPPEQPEAGGVVRVDFGSTRRAVARDGLFDAHLAEKYEPQEIEGRRFHAADVLFALDPASYDDARQEWEDQFLEGVAQTFPHPIAHCFHRFQNEESVGRRVDLLLDTFEAIVVVLEAILLGEVQRDGTAISNSGINRHQIDSRNLADRVHVVRKLVSAHPSTTSRRVDDAILRTFDELRSIRNTVAHGSTPPDDVAAELLARAEPLVVAVLKATSWLGDVELLRHERRLEDMERIQVFVGESVSRKLRERRYADELVKELRASETWHVFACVDGELVLLAPLVVWRRGGAGKSELSALKKCVGTGSEEQVFYESFGDCGEQPIDAPGLRSELSRLKSLFVTREERRA